MYQALQTSKTMRVARSRNRTVDLRISNICCVTSATQYHCAKRADVVDEIENYKKYNHTFVSLEDVPGGWMHQLRTI